MDAVDLDFPFTGDWLVQNSPANRIPSHRTRLFASDYAIDFVPVLNGRSAPLTWKSLVRPESPARFPGFGRPLLAPIEGTVIAVVDSEPDHETYRGLPSVKYAVTQRHRVAAGWQSLAGNHLVIESDQAIVALCHLQKASLKLQPGDLVRVGDPVARCGNSGNSTEPHLHIQAFDNPDVEGANGVPISFRGSIPRNGQIVTV